MIRHLELSLQRFYLVNAIQNDRLDKVFQREIEIEIKIKINSLSTGQHHQKWSSRQGGPTFELRVLKVRELLESEEEALRSNKEWKRFIKN